MKVTQGKSAKQKLLKWVNLKIPELGIKIFSLDWQNGKAFCVIIHVTANIDLKPGNSSLDNLKAVLSCVFDNMNIPRIIDPEDIVEAPNKLLRQLLPRDYGGVLNLVDLLNWVNQKIPEFHLTNWTTHRRNVCALCALVEVIGPRGNMCTQSNKSCRSYRFG